MLKTILIGLDGSEYCQTAARTAIAIAKNFGCTLHGLGIIDVPAIFDHSPGAAGSFYFKEASDQKQYESAMARIGECLSKFEEACKAEGVKYFVRHNEGSPREEFIKEAAGYDCILFGQKTYFEREKREGPDTILLDLLKDTPRPILVAPKDVNYRKEDPAVIAYDGSLASSRALQLFTLVSYDNPQNAGAVHLVTVSDNVDEGRAKQSRAADFLERWYGKPPTTEVLRPKPSDSSAILHYAKRVNARIITMGAYGTRGLRSLFFGSCTRNILEKAECLLFLYH